MENGKTDAMAPKKNAAPAEAPKSLGATIQNVSQRLSQAQLMAKLISHKGLTTLQVTHNKKVQNLLSQCNLLKLVMT